MDERLLQYIWKTKLFDPKGLKAITGEDVRIVHGGNYNVNAGPDFLDARIYINEKLWAGHVELHVKNSDWLLHKHDADAAYENVILHVVWQFDKPAPLAFPVLELQNHIPNLLLGKYKDLMNAFKFIPCENLISLTDELVLKSWKERMLVERLTHKAFAFAQYNLESRNNWEETFWWMIASNFGMPVNKDAFEKIARSIPVSILAKCKSQLIQLEALLLGQAGLLTDVGDDAYPNLLKREYLFLQNKYSLKPAHTTVQFLRMRPANFPSIRLVQLAALIHRSSHLFSTIIDTNKNADLLQLLDVTANDYWHYHYHFHDSSAYRIKKLGTDMKQNILINTFYPAMFAYGTAHNNDLLKSRAIAGLEELPAEKNKIINNFNKLGVPCNNAGDSQALIHLYKNYCIEKRCLDCAIGNNLLKKA